MGLLAASWLGNSLEDLLALALAGGSQLRGRAEPAAKDCRHGKGKVAATVGKFVADVQAEVKTSVAAVLAEVEA